MFQRGPLLLVADTATSELEIGALLRQALSWLLPAVIILAVLTAAPQHAQARLHHGGVYNPAAVTCTGNGQSGANVNSSFLGGTALFSAALQDGQPSILTSHPMTFCVPGVDYAVGYDTTIVLKDPTIQANLPANCTYTSATKTVLCNSASSITFDGFDLSGDSSGGVPTFLQFGSNFNAASTCTITHNKFRDDASLPNLITIGGSCARVIKYNQFEGGPGVHQITDNAGTSSATLDMEYNAFLSWIQIRVIGASTGAASRTIKYNYIYGLNSQVSGSHGEIDLYGGQGGPYNIPAVEWTGNFIVFPQLSFTVDNTTTFYMSTGANNGINVAATTINKNVIVTNRTTTGGPNMGNVLTVGGWATLGNVTINSNYFSPYGAFGCSVNGATNQNDVATLSGNTATLTSGSVTPQVGYNINGTGMTQATITNVAGNVYTFDGPPQSLGSIAITVTPGITSLASSGNVNLTDGSNSDLSGPRLFGTCNNHY